MRRFLRHWPFACGALSVGIGVFSLLGWWLGHASWTRIVLTYPPTTANGGLMAILSGVSLILSAPAAASRRRSIVGKVFAGAVALIAGLTLLEHLLGIDFGIDQMLLAAPADTRFHRHQARPSPQTASAYVFLAAALLSIDWTPRGKRPAEVFALIAGVIPLVALLGYLFGTAVLYQSFTVSSYIGTGISTAVALLALSSGTMAARADTGVLSVMSADDSGGYAARQLVAALAIVAAATCVIAIGARLGTYDAPIGSALILLLTSVGGSAFILRVARRLSRLDAERAASREQLRLAEAKSSGILSISADAIISMDDRQRITAFNEGAEAVFGYSKEETIGQPIDMLIPERFRRKHPQHVENFAAGEETARHMGTRAMPISGRRKNGEEFPADAAISKLDVGGIRIFTVSMRDVTEQRRRENEKTLLVEVGEILSSSLDYETTLPRVAQIAVASFADLCVVDLASDGEVRRLSAVSRDPSHAWICDVLMEAVLEGTHRDLLRLVIETRRPHVAERVPPEALVPSARGAVHRRFLDAVGLTSAVAVPLVTPSGLLGAMAFVRTSASRPYDSADVGLAMEIAERAALSIENGRLYRTAQRAIQARDDVLGIVAHDLRNPLGTILMQANLLRAVSKGDGKPTDVIERAAKRMNRLIQDLLDVTRMEAGRLRLEIARIDTGRLLSDVIEAQTPLARSGELDLRLDAAPNLPDVSGDRDRLLQVFENLIGNAVKFTPAKGRITVAARARDGDVLFSVADTGMGIDAKDVPHLFDRFWQARGATHEGAGLGLPIAKGIVEAHGGRIWVDTAPLRGSTFSFTIPAYVRVDASRKEPALHR